MGERRKGFQDALGGLSGHSRRSSRGTSLWLVLKKFLKVVLTVKMLGASNMQKPRLLNARVGHRRWVRGRLKGELEATCRPTCRRRPSDLDIFSISDFQLSRMGQRCKFQRLPSRPMIAELFQPECGVLRSTVCHLSPRHAFGLPDRCHAW